MKSGLKTSQNGLEDLRSAIIADAGQLWWDIRIHHNYPTVEFRVCDAVPLVDDVVALSALTQAYVARLLDTYQKGEFVERTNRVLLEENRWRAARFGSSAELLEYSSKCLVPLEIIVTKLCAELEPYADRFRSERYLERVLVIARTGSAALRQLAAWNRGRRDLKEVVGVYQAETEAI